MPTGLNPRLVRQAGEHFVAGELARRGYVTAIDTGGLPDIVASTDSGRRIPVQVKTIAGATWQFTITQFCAISFEGHSQVVGEVKHPPVERLICVMVRLQEPHDRFFVLPWTQLRDIVVADYRAYLERHGGQRPRKWDSLHCAARPDQLAAHENDWALLDRPLR